MIRKSMAVLGVVIGAAFVVAGCDDPASKQDSARKAQIEADQTRAEAQRKADKELAKGEAEALNKEKTVEEDRAKADDGLDKARADYRTKLQNEIADLDVKVEEIKAGASLAAPAARDDMERALRDVTTHRSDLTADLRKIDNVGADGWKSMKESLDKDLDAYKTSIKTASSRIKALPGRVKTEPNPKFPATARPGELPRTTPPIAPYPNQNHPSTDTP